MSFQVQPAPRISQAPAAEAASTQAARALQPTVAAASNAPHQQGSSSSQVPIGRSARDSRR